MTGGAGAAWDESKHPRDPKGKFALAGSAGGEQLPPEFRWDGKGVPPPEFSGYSFAQWAAYFAADDAARIDGAVRGGVLSGLDNVEIGRKVVGSASLNGIDGQTEITRRKIARLGVAEIKRTIRRKKKNKR